MSLVRIWGGRAIDPASGLDRLADVRLEGDRVVAIAPDLPPTAGETAIDARGCVVAPGLVDLHCRLGDGDHDDTETLTTLSRAAAAGGFTTVCLLGDGEPRLDHGAELQALRQRAEREAGVRVLPLGTITRGGDGGELAELGELAEAGAPAFADGTRPVRGSRLLRHALSYAAMFDRRVVEQPCDPDLARGGVMHEGAVATRLGLPGIPAAAEEIAVARAIALARLTGARLHLAALSSARAVEAVRTARAEGLPVTAAVQAHHLLLDETAVARGAGDQPYLTATKLDPPLRGAADRAALRAGVADGTLVVVSGHTPCRSIDKDCEYAYASAGASALETALGILLELSAQGALPLSAALHALTVGPAAAFGLPAGRLAVGAPADVTVLAPDARWLVDAAQFHSRGRSTPLAGAWLRGRVVATLVGGRVVWRAEE